MTGLIIELEVSYMKSGAKPDKVNMGGLGLAFGEMDLGGYGGMHGKYKIQHLLSKKHAFFSFTRSSSAAESYNENQDFWGLL